MAFHVGNIVPGIDFTNDPLMQGRLFSYTDTQLIRLGGPNFHEIPINRPVVPVHNNQRDGFMRQTINKGKNSYNPNTTGGGCPFQAGQMQGGFTSYEERIDTRKIRERSRSFFDHFSQATLFFNSQSEPEKNHLIDALSFELGKVQDVAIRERMLRILTYVDKGMASRIATALGLPLPKSTKEPLNQGVPADGDASHYEPIIQKSSVEKSAALSMANTVKDNIRTRKIAILAADGVNSTSLNTAKKALVAEGATAEVIAPHQGNIAAENDEQVAVDQSFLTAASVLYDAVYVPGGAGSISTLQGEPDAIHFLNEAYRHCKAIAADSDALPLLDGRHLFC